MMGNLRYLHLSGFHQGLCTPIRSRDEFLDVLIISF